MRIKNIFILILTGLFMATLSSCVLEEEYEPTRVNELIDSMSLKDKITQMMMVDFRNYNDEPFRVMNDEVLEIVDNYSFGALIYFRENLDTTTQSFNLTKAFQERQIEKHQIPYIITTDQEGGSVYRLNSGTALPGNMAISATSDPHNAYLSGKIIGSELASLGINSTLAPVVDVNNNPNNPVIGLRSYGDNPEMVGLMASKMIQGLKEEKVISCAKHFPGHGDTATDSHYGLPMVEKDIIDLSQNELKPFKAAIENDVEMIMTAHILYPLIENNLVFSEKTQKLECLPATLSKEIITNLLKNQMHFKGVVTTDALNMEGISNTFNEDEACILAIKAGVDMLCMPTKISKKADLVNLDKIINSIIDAVETGKIKKSRINDAVRRILTLKEKHGLLDLKSFDLNLDDALKTVGSKEHRELERELAAKGVTVIKNENNVLPLQVKNKHILMLTPYNNELGQMAMGFNRAKKVNLIDESVTCKILRFTKDTTLESLKEELEKADIIILNSEISRASKMAYEDSYLSGKVEMFTTYAKENGKQSIVISIDKPYDVSLYKNADAILAVYGAKGSTLDVTEALNGNVTETELAYGPNIIAGVEVIFGVYGASGKLPINIYEFDPIAKNFTDKIIYNRGYGLTYNSLLK